MTVRIAPRQESQQRGWILLALMCTMMLAAMDTTIVATAIPQIVGDLGGFSMFSWVFSVYLLAQTVTIPIYGKLADLYGRKPVLLIGTIIFLIGSATSGASWNMTSLILFRGLQGLGAGSIMATVNTIAGDIYSISERAKVQGWLSSVWGMAAIIGPTLGGALAEYASWRWIFMINLPIGIVSILLIVIFFKEHIKKQSHKIDYVGAIMMLAAGTALIFTLMEGGQSWPWFSLKGLGMITLSIVLILITILIETKSPEPILPNWVWRNKILTGANLSMICMGAILLGPGMYLPLFSQSVLGLGAIAAGLILASSSIGWPIASWYSGKLYKKMDFRNTAILGSILITISSLLFLFIPFNTSPWLLVMNQILLGGGFGLLSTPTLVGVQSIVTWGQRGVVTGSNMFFRYLGQSIGAAVLGGVFNAAISNQLKTTPIDIKKLLPENVNDVITVLQSGKASDSVEDYLRHLFYSATHHVYFLMAGLGIVSMIFLLMLPRKFPVIDE